MLGLSNRRINNNFVGGVVSIAHKKLQAILGEHGINRFREFKTGMNPESFAKMELFLSLSPPPNTGIFLSEEGNLTLGWEDENGKVVEIEFFPDRMEYYIESMDEEGTLKNE